MGKEQVEKRNEDYEWRGQGVSLVLEPEEEAG